MFARIFAVSLVLCAFALPAHAIIVYVPITVPAPEPGNYANIHKVGIVAVLGDTIRLHKVIKFLNAKTEQRNIADWKVNELVAATIHQTLGTRFELVDMPVDEATAPRQIDPGLFLNNMGSLRKFLQAYNRTDLDAYLVVRPFVIPGVAGQEMGIGLEMLRDEPPWLWTNYEITMVDAKTFATIARSYARLRLRDGTPPAFPGLKTPMALMMDDQLTPAAAHTELLKTWTLRLVRLTMVETLRSLEFGVTMPPTAERALVPIPKEAQLFSNVHNVAVISAIGDQLELHQRGTLFRHWERSVPVADWNFDSEIEAMVRAQLDKRFTVRAVAVDRARLAKSVPPISNAALSAPIDGLTSTSEIDAYIVVLKQEGRVLANDPAHGIGLLRIDPMGESRTEMYARYTIAIVDAKSLKPIAMRVGVGGPHFQGNFPGHVIDNAVFPEKDGDITPANAQVLHQMFKDLIADSLDETMLRAGLRGVMLAPLTAVDATGAPIQPPAPTQGTRRHPLPADGATVPGRRPVSGNPPPVSGILRTDPYAVYRRNFGSGMTLR